MTTLSKDEVVKMAREAGYRADAKMHDHDYDLFLNFYTLCRAPLVAEVERLKKGLSTVDVILALQADRDDWKARALKAEQVGEPDLSILSANAQSRIREWIADGTFAERAIGVIIDQERELMDYEAAESAPQPAAQEQTSAVPVVRQMVEALERKLPGGKQTDDFESSRIGDYNQGWNDYRKAVKKMFKNINMNSSENSNPDAYLYSLEYGEKVVDTKVSIHQLNYPFGVAGADYLVRNDDGVSYVRQTKLYAALSRAIAAGQKFIKENGK